MNSPVAAVSGVLCRIKAILTLLVFTLFMSVAFAADKNDATKAAEEPVFREPFTLRLHVDKEHFYEQKIEKIPFVHQGDVYLLKGDEFGLALEIKDNAIVSVKYQPNLKKADVTLKFTQEIMADGGGMMLLNIHNNTKVKLNADVLMTVAGQKGVQKTNILPVPPSMSGFESWPDPIVQLVLRNIRIEK